MRGVQRLMPRTVSSFVSGINPQSSARLWERRARNFPWERSLRPQSHAYVVLAQAACLAENVSHALEVAMITIASERLLCHKQTN